MRKLTLSTRTVTVQLNRRACWCGNAATFFVTDPAPEHLCEGCYGDWCREFDTSPDAQFLADSFVVLPLRVASDMLRGGDWGAA